MAIIIDYCEITKTITIMCESKLEFDSWTNIIKVNKKVKERGTKE